MCAICVGVHTSMGLFPRLQKTVLCHIYTGLFSRLHTTAENQFCCIRPELLDEQLWIFFQGKSIIGKVKCILLSKMKFLESNIYFISFQLAGIEGIVWHVLMRPTRSSVLLNSFPTTPCSLVLSSPVPSLCQDWSLKASVFIFPSFWNALPHTLVWLISSDFRPQPRCYLLSKVFSDYLTKSSSLHPQHNAPFYSPITLTVSNYTGCILLPYCLSLPLKSKLCESRNLVWIVILHPDSRA